jgi:hypothetical protein
MKCLHGDEVSVLECSVYMLLKCLYWNSICRYNETKLSTYFHIPSDHGQKFSNFHIDGVVWCVVGCWLVGEGGELCIRLCLCWRPHQPAGTQAAPPHGAAPRTFSHALITRLLYTQRCLLSMPTFVLHCVCLLICVCVCVQFSLHVQ